MFRRASKQVRKVLPMRLYGFGFGVWVPVLGTYYESQRCIVLIETFD